MAIFDLKRIQDQPEEPDGTRRYCILVVDDEPDNLRAFTSFLKKEYDVVTALDGARALEIMRAAPERFHLIISDQRMPHISGVEFLEQTRDLNPRAKRIILSGYTDADAIIASVNRARIHEFILKPVERNKLLLTVRRALEAYALEEANADLVKDLTRLNADLERKVGERSMDGFGNVAFGVKEYIDFPGAKYDPKIGMMGFDVCISLRKPGARIARRRIATRRLPKRQRVSNEEAKAFLSEKFGVTFVTE